uniref:Multifunctional methyltransferase subunit TRM112-like protein n=1 Tax=Phallusia mammillata TaxID=59560 RepID=A0A6F9DW45_9ASCI|nr:multifunctional methyltransferase subunit TRM112-like protein [Phallusia mammillata]
MLLSRILNMRLITHNMLTSHVKGVTNGYPLIIEATEVEEKEVDFNPEFISRMMSRIEWPALVKAMEWIGKKDCLPEEPIENCEKDNDFLQKAHHALMEIEVITGSLKCPESGRKFPISNGIPNMLLNEDEV